MSAIAKNGIIYQGGTPVIDILNADLQALIQAGTYDPYVLYNITDVNDNENIIDDNNISTNTTWSSSKVNSNLTQTNNNLTTFVGKGIVNTINQTLGYVTNMQYDSTKKRHYATVTVDFDVYDVIPKVVEVTKSSDSGSLIPFATFSGKTITYGCYDNGITQAIIGFVVFGHKS